jgi:hypothetical protein
MPVFYFPGKNYLRAKGGLGQARFLCQQSLTFVRPSVKPDFGSVLQFSRHRARASPKFWKF